MNKTDLKSCIYQGQVIHHRYLPHEHRFRYPVFLMYLDLAELDQVFQGRWFWSTRRLNLACFLRKDYFGDKTKSLENSVRELVYEKTGHHPEGPIRLLTNLRYYGYIFNPVSYYYCFDRDDQRIEHVVAEITNTPWKERHYYVISRGESENVLSARHGKEFHVSPFMPMNLDYQWHFTKPVDSLGVGVSLLKEGKKVFAAGMRLKRVPITGRSLARSLCTFPPMTIKTVMAIYWQAWLLKRKKTPYYPHPKSVRDAYNSSVRMNNETEPVGSSNASR